ncbi:bacteriorhodopsin [Gloeocapsopsis crepidinum LEGE 06123]|uniref:Bacteriorhodopsin n=1 Tax=Gloeocapsopsis crepidinum LEGE 06123 TaxID=588587 RepID=A0ABR9UUA4_9CHRO|nr:bacteriorhodopsin [Gloeocapsopsis crepidinum]MBE9191880.1 bacteriorhodopsin [Gloeocapsopsis crepidinum LEGE 06123]
MRYLKKLISLAVVSSVLVAIAAPILAQAQSPLPPDAIQTSAGINFENLLTYTPFQHGIVGHVLTLGYAAQAAGFVYFITTSNNIAPRYRLSSSLSAVVMVSAFLELLQLSQDWRSAFVYTDGLWRPTNDAFSNGFRYMNWSIDVPMLLLQLVVILGLTRKQAFSYGTQFIIGGLLMIYTGYIGQFYEVTNPIPFWIWGAISTVFYIYVLFVIGQMINKSADNLPKQPDNLPKAMRNVFWYILVTWTLYPIAYLMPVISFSAWGVVARQIIYTVADITTKVIYGAILSYIARKHSEALEYEPAVATSRR